MTLEKLIQSLIDSTIHQRIVDSTISILKERKNILENEQGRDTQAGFGRIARQKGPIVNMIKQAIEILESTPREKEIEIKPNIFAKNTPEEEEKEVKKLLHIITEALNVAITKFLKTF